MAMLNNQMVNHPFFPLNSMKNRHFHGVFSSLWHHHFTVPLCSSFAPRCWHQEPPQVMHLSPFLAQGLLNEASGSHWRGVFHGQLYGYWENGIYIYIRLIIWGSSILPVIWGTRIWSSNQWWWFMGELWENFQNYGTGNGIMEWWWANRLLFGCFNLHSENYENQLGLLFRNIWEKTCPKPPTSL